MARLSKEEAKHRIVVAAMKAFARKGFSETSVQDIANACGMQPTAVLYHFKHKVGIMEAVLLTIIAENRTVIASLADPSDSALDRLMKHFYGHYQWAIDHDYNARIMTTLYYFASYDKAFTTLYTKILKVARDRILEHLLAGMREGLFRIDGDPADVSQILHDQLLGSLINIITTERQRDTFSNAERKWRTLVATLTNHRVDRYLV